MITTVIQAIANGETGIPKSEAKHTMLDGIQHKILDTVPHKTFPDIVLVFFHLFFIVLLACLISNFMSKYRIKIKIVQKRENRPTINVEINKDHESFPLVEI